MAQLVFEIGVEELPALSIEPAMSFMASYMKEALEKERLIFSDIQVGGTPRRLVLMIEDLAPMQEQISEEILGPNVLVAYEQDGSFSKAALGFIKSKNLDPKAIYRQKTDKGEVIAAKILSPKKATKDLLPDMFVALMRAIPFKKRMRWEDSQESFARPIRRLLCLFDNTYLDFKFAGVSSGDFSSGHRFLAPEFFKVTSISQYKKEMAERYVILDPAMRESMFIKAAQDKLKALNARFQNDADLMATARNLMEYPFAIVGAFEEKYLAIPKEILVCEMKTHQKSFAVLGEDGELLPYFVCTSGTKPFNEEFFAQGNARVLRARFEDGAYYFGEDQKKSLEQHALGLSNLVFERDLGTYKQKAERIEKLSLALAKILELNDEALLKKAASLLKADLVSGVVGQFPELQGVMGRIYAGLDGEEPALCDAIEMHYWPRFAEDMLPTSKSAALLSLADKLDTLVGIIALDKKPKGNKDPFGLRRAAIGIVRILVSFGFNIDLEKLSLLALSNYEQFKPKASKLVPEICDYIIQRARGILVEELGSFADSILAVGSSNLVDIFARANALFSMRSDNPQEFESLSQAFKRAGNIVKKAQSTGELLTNISALDALLNEPSEKSLLKAVRDTQEIISEHSLKKSHDLKASYAQIFSHLALIKKPLDAFFDNVMVMVEDKNLRQARLTLLGEIKHVADKIADFTHL